MGTVAGTGLLNRFAGSTIRSFELFCNPPQPGSILRGEWKCKYSVTQGEGIFGVVSLPETGMRGLGGMDGCSAGSQGDMG